MPEYIPVQPAGMNVVFTTKLPDGSIMHESFEIRKIIEVITCTQDGDCQIVVKVEGKNDRYHVQNWIGDKVYYNIGAVIQRPEPALPMHHVKLHKQGMKGATL